MDEDIFQKINPEIYYDLKKHSWFRKAFPTLDDFDCRIYDSSRKYFGYIKLKERMNEEFIIFRTNMYVWIYRILWLVFWFYAIYSAYRWSIIAAYFLFLMVLSGYIGIIGKGQWEKRSLKISIEGCEIDKTIILNWDDISGFIIIPYFMNKETNDIVFVYIVSGTGILYKFNISSFTFTSSQINKKYLPVYVEYFRERSEKPI